MFGLFGDDLPPGDPRTWSQQPTTSTFRVNPLVKTNITRSALTPPPPSEPEPTIGPLLAGGIGAGFGFVLGFLFRRRGQ